ncbi:MAG: DUF2497 domain-containing protein [Rhodospirillales bacterium]|nr:DUF2497 domain-containing protein [Rhodospirillales bacterium]MCB9995750.1 DUF2497 domain-containing protein [Rhodospirillales bacterium]
MSQEQEPSIEEILASIRQIISDDDEEESVQEAAPEPEPEPEPVVEDEDDDILELTDKVDDDPVIEEDEEEEEIYEPPPRVEIDMQDSDDDDDDDGDSIFTDSAESAAFEGFAALASKTALDRKGTGSTTIEDIVREMMKPMLREWLDVHLPPLIEKIVQRELRKVARRASDED